MSDSIKEVIFVGLPGPTHNYGGLSADNVASTLNRGSISNPKQAAYQALDLVRLLKTLGVTVGILPPQLRPYLPELARQFSGTADDIIRKAAHDAPGLLEKMTSSSAMWTANACTTTPGIDNLDGRLHLTVANLHTNLHRRVEAEDTYRVLSAIFAKVPECDVHAPLDAAQGYRDEGAANHMRLAPRHGEPALNIFVYGADGSPDDPPTARQSLSAFKAIQKQHTLPDRRALFVRQHPAMIGAGVFHNDVIAVSNASVLLAHERAYARGMQDIAQIAGAYRDTCGEALTAIIIKEDDLEVEEAVHTYFFNSQIVSKPDGSMAIIAPTETRDLYAGKAARLFESIRADDGNPINEIHFADLRQSMNNGGGPACLRLRVPMRSAQLAAIAQNVNVLADDALLNAVGHIIAAHYPEALAPEDIANPALYHACERMLAQLGALMKLPLIG